MFCAHQSVQMPKRKSRDETTQLPWALKGELDLGAKPVNRKPKVTQRKEQRKERRQQKKQGRAARQHTAPAPEPVRQQPAPPKAKPAKPAKPAKSAKPAAPLRKPPWMQPDLQDETIERLERKLGLHKACAI